MLTLEKILKEQGPFLGGEEFGVGDVAVASYLLFVPQFFPQVLKIYSRCVTYSHGL